MNVGVILSVQPPRPAKVKAKGERILNGQKRERMKTS
jgi:hypothetical protein